MWLPPRVSLLVVEVFVPGFGLPGVSGLILTVIGVVITWRNYGPVAGLAVTLIALALAGIAISVSIKSAANGKLSRSALILNEVTPAEVDESIADEIQDVSSKLYDLLDCRGVVRFDYIYNEERQRLTFLEVNTIPGQSAESIVPKQARAMGISTAQLYEMIIEEALSK